MTKNNDDKGIFLMSPPTLLPSNGNSVCSLEGEYVRGHLWVQEAFRSDSQMTVVCWPWRESFAESEDFPVCVSRRPLWLVLFMDKKTVLWGRERDL